MTDFLPAKERTKPMMMTCTICKQEKMCWIICDDCWKLIDQGIYVQCPICLCFVHKDEECKHENLKYRNIDYSNVGRGSSKIFDLVFIIINHIRFVTLTADSSRNPTDLITLRCKVICS